MLNHRLTVPDKLAGQNVCFRATESSHSMAGHGRQHA